MVWTTIFVTSQPEPRTRWGRVVRRQVDVITCDGAPPGRGLSPLTEAFSPKSLSAPAASQSGFIARIDEK